MALTPRSGFSITTSGLNDVPGETPTSVSDLVDNMPFVTDTLLNKNAIDPTLYPSTNKMLDGFIKGKRITVTYYRLLKQGGQNNRSNIADLPTMRDVINTKYQKIINLEITLPKGFDFTANQAQANMTITGQAMFYKNMNPSTGDLFITSIGDGRMGLCQISSVAPMSWMQDRIYTATFVVRSFLDAQTADPLEGMVTTTSVFDKTNYLGGTAALLSEVTYKQLNQIRAFRQVLCRSYHQAFFDTELCTYVRPSDGMYDPWLTKFVVNKITLDDVPVRAKQLLGDRTKLYNQTLWARLENQNNITLVGVSPYVNVQINRSDALSVFFTELQNRPVLYPTASESEGQLYLFSASFYSGDTDTMTPFELVIFTAITQTTMGDLSSLIVNYLDLVWTLSVDEQYTTIPLYLHLIDMALKSQYREIDAPPMSFGGLPES